MSSTIQNGKDAKELKLAKNMPMFSSVEAIYSKMLTLLIGKLFLEISFDIVFLVPRNGFDFESSTKFYRCFQPVMTYKQENYGDNTLV